MSQTRLPPSIVLSAATPTQLVRVANRLSDALAARPDVDLADVAYTLQTGRRGLTFRHAAVLNEIAGAVAHLAALDETAAVQAFTPCPVAFAFPGQGTQYPGMTRWLYERLAVFRSEVDQACEVLVPELGLDLREMLYPDCHRMGDMEVELSQTRLTQPALFVVEYALARLWMAWGVVPAAMIGQSVGELVAATVAGVFERDDALRLVADRGRYIQSEPEGAMVAISTDLATAQRFTNAEVHVAVTNGPNLVVLGASLRALGGLLVALREAQIPACRLRSSHAFHTPNISGAKEAFGRAVRRAHAYKPSIPYVSNVTGEWATAKDATSPEYWVRQMVEPVRFDQGLRTLLNGQRVLLLEVGPGSTILGLARGAAALGTQALDLIPSLGSRADSRPGADMVASGLGSLWSRGATVDWRAVHMDESRRRVSLPTYPFERQRHWIDRTDHRPPHASAGPKKGGERLGFEDWFWVQKWSEHVPGPPNPATVGQWLVLGSETATGAAIVTELKRRGGSVTECSTEEINPTSSEAFQPVVDKIATDMPLRIIHTWGASPRHRGQVWSFFSLVALARALANRRGTAPVDITVLTIGMVSVTDHDRVDPMRALALGPVRVAPLELESVDARAIDISPQAPASVVVDVILSSGRESLLALREVVLAPRFEPLKANAPCEPPMRERGVYVVTGGFGGIGLSLARALARRWRPRLVLLTRSALSPACDPHVRRRLEQVEALEAQGAEVLVWRGDVADRSAVAAMAAAARDRFGTVDGVFHTAGVASGGLLAARDPKDMAPVLSPKVDGTLALAESFLAGPEPVRFLVLCSSHNSLLGRIGQVDYCSANAFLDAFAQIRGRRTLVQSINWGVWADVGMAVDTAVPDALREWRRGTLELGIQPQEGVRAFLEVLSSGCHQVVVSTTDFEAMRREHHRGERQRFREAMQRLSASKPPRRVVRNGHSSVAPQTPLETQLVRLWSDVLGVEHVRITDNFLDLGGHSLLATLLLARVRRELDIELSLRAFLEEPTIEGILRAAESAGPTSVGTSVTSPTDSAVTIAPARRRRMTLPIPQRRAGPSTQQRPVAPALSVMFFAAESTGENEVYGLLLEVARFADEHGFRSVWTPERHFNAFGGNYPSPSVISGALAIATKRVGLCAGSVISPLGNPLRIAEEWAVVDRLSGGRVGVSFGSGWHANDFVLAPEAYSRRKEVMFEHIELVRRLWRGESVRLPNGAGLEVDVRVHPRPAQAEVPIWVTGESAETFERAGRIGANVLTAMMHQDCEQLAERILLYRRSRESAGYAPDAGRITLMQHTFVTAHGIDARLQAAYRDYVRVNLTLQSANVRGQGVEQDTNVDETDLTALAEQAFARLATERGLVGSPEHCERRARELHHIGVDEIACLVDFLSDTELVRQGLPALDDLRERLQPAGERGMP